MKLLIRIICIMLLNIVFTNLVCWAEVEEVPVPGESITYQAVWESRPSSLQTPVVWHTCYGYLTSGREVGNINYWSVSITTDRGGRVRAEADAGYGSFSCFYCGYSYSWNASGMSNNGNLSNHGIGPYFRGYVSWSGSGSYSSYSGSSEIYLVNQSTGARITLNNSSVSLGTGGSRLGSTHTESLPGSISYRFWAPRYNNFDPAPLSRDASNVNAIGQTLDLSGVLGETSVYNLSYYEDGWRTGHTNRVMSAKPSTPGARRLTLTQTGTWPPKLADKYTTIGVWKPQIIGTDGDGDRTRLQIVYRVHTLDELPLTITYGSNAAIVSIRGETYDIDDVNLPCGGEEGWTNQHLSFATGNPVWPGDTYTLQLSSDASGFATVRNDSAAAVRNNYRTNTGTNGNSATAQVTVRGDASIPLSAATTKQFKIDTTRPVANVTHNGGTSFTCNSTDELSGLSLTRPTKVALIVGSATPDDTDYHELDAIPDMPLGTYNLWVWATDKAGNEHKVRRSTNLRISGEVTLSKDTNAGATLHADGCVNWDRLTTLGSCEADCQMGANALLLESTELTYILRLHNTDVSVNSSGSFSDELPAGFVPIGNPTRVNISGTGNINSLSRVLSGDRWTVSGNFTNLGSNAVMEIHIRGTLPAFDENVSANNFLSNQASIIWRVGSGAQAVDGTATSNYANHRVSTPPMLRKASNWGAAEHGVDCTNSDSLDFTDTCDVTCVIGNPGTVQEGDLITYELTFYNPVDSLLYFATDALANYDLMPTSLDMTGQSYQVEYIDAGGVTTTPWMGNVSASGTTLNQAMPYTDGTFVGGLTLRGNRIYQQANTAISIAPKATLIITVTAVVSGDAGDVLTNQVVSGFSTTGSNTANLRITDAGVETIKSNYTTHHIEQGTTLQKWAYSDTNAANDPTSHAPLCMNASNMLTPAGCTTGVCTGGTAKLQAGNIITYALTMDNSKSSRVARNLDGTVLDMGVSSPGIQMTYKHLDNQIPQGLTPDISTLRAYVTDMNGNNVSIFDGGMANSSLEAVNENGTTQMREVMELSVGTTDIYHMGTSDQIFQLQNANLYLSGTAWVWESDTVHQHRRGTQHDQGTYSITYLFDAEVTGSYDEMVPSNNLWKNHWEQHNPWTVNNPETGVATTPINASYISNSVVHARITDGVDTKFTKVGADNLGTGLSGAEFALYKWDGSNPPTTTQANHMVDSSVLIDTATLPAGQWVRVKENGEDALITDIFISGSSPLGEVNLGKLPTGTYTLVETKAPSGYALPVGQWILTIDSEKGDSGADDWKIDFVGKSASIAPPAAIRDEMVPNAPTYKIINAEPFLIGLSGLGGTTGMLLIGFVIMAVAGNVYLVQSYKRRKKQKQKDMAQ